MPDLTESVLPMHRVHARIYGRVQGVYFRASTQARAESLGLVGWVRNRRDGTVELVAEGPRASVEQLMSWVRAGGPEHARVDEVDRVDGEAVGLEPPFTIRPSH